MHVVDSNDRVAGELIAQIRRPSGSEPGRAGAPRRAADRSVLSAYAHGRRQPSVAALARIARGGGVGAASLAPRADRDATGALRRRSWSQVLDLAESLPFRAAAELAYPPLIRLRGMSELGDRLLAVHDALDAARHPARDRRRHRARLLHARTARHAGPRRQRVRRPGSRTRRCSRRCRRASRSAARSLEQAERDGQVRLRWEQHADRPVPQRAAVPRSRRRRTCGRFRSRIARSRCSTARRWRCSRRCSTAPRDWADIEAMVEARALDLEASGDPRWRRAHRRMAEHAASSARRQPRARRRHAASLELLGGVRAHARRPRACRRRPRRPRAPRRR